MQSYTVKHQRLPVGSPPPPTTCMPRHFPAAAMASKPQRQKEDDGAHSTLDAAIQDLTYAKDACGVPPAQVAFGSVSNLLVVTRVRPLPQFAVMEFRFTLIQGSVVDKQDYTELALFCVDICKTLDRGLSGRRLDELGKSVLASIEQLTT
jgi:hypothetical protein